MSVMQVLECEEISLLVTSFLSPDACWCLRHANQKVLSKASAPRVRRALAWRQEFSQLFAYLEMILSTLSSEVVSLQEIQSSFAASLEAGISDVRLGQLLALTGELITIREQAGELALGQQSHEGEVRAQKISELYARSLCFESTLASMTEEFACNRVPTRELSLRPVKRRRLSRQASVTLPKGAQIQAACEHIKVYKDAVAMKRECEKWRSLVCGAEGARVVLEHLFAKGGVVTVERVVQILASQRSTLRLANPLPLDWVPAAIMLLLSRTSGGLAITSVKKSRDNDRMCFQPFQGTSSARARGALERDLLALERKYEQLRLDIKSAFLGMMKAGNSDAVSEADMRSASSESLLVFPLLPLRLETSLHESSP